MTQFHCLRCTFIPQVWLLDNACEVDLPDDFERNWYVVHSGPLPAERSYESDSLRESHAAPDWVQHWPGPFEVDYEVIDPSMNPLTLVGVDIARYIDDCPPYDVPVDKTLIPELIEEIARRFDYTGVYDQVDRLCCAVLRERGIEPSAPAAAGE